MCNKDESSTVVNTGQANPLSVPSTVGVLKRLFIYIGRKHNMYELLIICLKKYVFSRALHPN
jgi:hypothetical protein